MKKLSSIAQIGRERSQYANIFFGDSINLIRKRLPMNLEGEKNWLVENKTNSIYVLHFFSKWDQVLTCRLILMDFIEKSTLSNF